MRFSIFTLLSFISLSLAAPIQERSLSNIIRAIEFLLPPINGAITEVSGLITSAEEALALLTRTPTTENGLSGPCKKLTVLFARGTVDPGNVGFLTGPAWFEALGDIVGADNVAVQGVAPYSASVNGFLEGGDLQGAVSLAAQINQAVIQCPNTKLIVSGYSQGAQIVHNGAALLPAETMAKVNGVVLFGDPKKGQVVNGVDASKILTVCHQGDNICDGGDLVLLQHLTYAKDAASSAKWVVGKAGL